jgi:hypothetical protein
MAGHMPQPNVDFTICVIHWRSFTLPDFKPMPILKTSREIASEPATTVPSDPAMITVRPRG